MGIVQINQAVTKMDQTTQQNAVLVAQSKNHADQMNSTTLDHSKLVDFFV